MFNTKHNLGQGLIEVIVAIAIIASGLTAALSLTSTATRGSRVSTKQIVAANLAREGVEVVRNIRDSNWLQGNNWLTGLVDGTDYNGVLRYNQSTDSWSIDFTSNAMGDNTELVRNSSGRYLSILDEPNGYKTGFHRFLDMGLICENPTNNNIVVRYTGQSCPGGYDNIGLKVISQVDWLEDGQTKTFTIEENLYNWH